MAESNSISMTLCEFQKEPVVQMKTLATCGGQVDRLPPENQQRTGKVGERLIARLTVAQITHVS